VCEVAYREYTRDGHLRHPVFVRLRADKRPEECIGRFDDPHTAKLEPPVREVLVSNREKVFFPEKKLAKGDLVDYYEAIAPWMLPYLKDRALVLTRFPDGIHGKSFYQRDAPEFVPDWLQREVLWSESSEHDVHYFIAQDLPSLKYLANMGTIPIHSWHSRITDLEHPDWCVLDLDPKDAPFAKVIAAARAAKVLADELEFPAFLKTSGSTGLHVLLPLARQLTHDHARAIGELMARVLVNRHPDVVTINRSLRKRDGRVYIDYLQNGHGRLLVAPFSARAVPSAAVSMPLEWEELTDKLTNDKYHIKNAVKRMTGLSRDPLADVLTLRPDLEKVLERLATLLR
jgi:bifunctional non-homologous end joining protein LigD